MQGDGVSWVSFRARFKRMWKPRKIQKSSTEITEELTMYLSVYFCGKIS